MLASMPRIIYVIDGEYAIWLSVRASDFNAP